MQRIQTRPVQTAGLAAAHRDALAVVARHENTVLGRARLVREEAQYLGQFGYLHAVCGLQIAELAVQIALIAVGVRAKIAAVINLSRYHRPAQQVILLQRVARNRAVYL